MMPVNWRARMQNICYLRKKNFSVVCQQYGYLDPSVICESD